MLFLYVDVIGEVGRGGAYLCVWDEKFTLDMFNLVGTYLTSGLSVYMWRCLLYLDEIEKSFSEFLVSQEQPIYGRLFFFSEV